ncbi:hypothetical protein [Thalassospira sp. UBA1131]|jgi:hypothetical protein|uniref:hypothetical protein n=1 Tax=Thalassospira sp. UBA1131 TaxID=1947672 RepID=UPI0025DDDC59|nr:hypothetical protein [Thalassospira sp. UBA1131]
MSRSFWTDHRATLVQFKSSGPAHLHLKRPEKEKGGSSAIAEETAHFPTTHYKAKNLADISGPTRHWCSGQTINDALHVCVESKMRFLIGNHNPKNRQKSTLTLYQLIYRKIHYVRKFAHFISIMEQVLIRIVTQ